MLLPDTELGANTTKLMAMKKIRLIPTFVLALGLILSILAGTVTPVRAADRDMGDYLASALGVSSSELSNYPANYQNSLPVTYEKNGNSCYVALGGTTAAGGPLDITEDYANGYADLIAAQLGFEYGVDYLNAAAEAGLTSAEAVDYINNARKDPSKYIPQADLITFQLDGASFISSSMDGVVDKADIPWEKYVSDSAFLADIANFHSKMTAEYAGDYGQKNAESIATVLEWMLYESVVYSHETINAVQAIRAKNSSAVILVLGLYNPMRGLTFTANGKIMDLGGMIEELITVTNAYLLKQTKDMAKVAFVDISGAGTNGYSNENLNINDSDALTSQLNTIAKAEEKQYANKVGHVHIRDQVLNAAKAPCKHTQTKVENKKETSCKEPGYTGDTVCAECGVVITKGSEIAKKDHTYGAWSQTKAPECTEKGEESRTCSVCTHTETKDIDPTGHKLDNGTVTTKPTCTEKGVMTFTCTKCSYTETKDVDSTGHKLDNGTVTTKPTCTEKGVKTFACSACSYTETQAIDATGHNLRTAIITHKPTCTTNGLKTAFCSNCDYKEQQEVAPNGHKWDEGTVTTEPTCTQQGVKTFDCQNCSDSKTEVLVTIDHTWNEGEETKAPTCKEEGKLTFTCTTCTTTKTEAIAIIPHSWENATVSKNPTCEEAGEKIGTCSSCGETLTEVIPATGHFYGTYVSNGDATCQQDGTKTATCEICGANDTVNDTNTKVDHRYEAGTCTMCGAAEPANNSNLLIIVVASGVALFSGGMLAFLFFKKKSFVR